VRRLPVGHRRQGRDRWPTSQNLHIFPIAFQARSVMMTLTGRRGNGWRRGDIGGLHAKGRVGRWRFACPVVSRTARNRGGNGHGRSLDGDHQPRAAPALRLDPVTAQLDLDATTFATRNGPEVDLKNGK
jgi:hypothetical protein